MTSVGESQKDDITPVWTTESRLVSSSSFSRTVQWRTGSLRQSTFPHNFAKYSAVSKILSKQIQQ